jgi:hypothetical protein
MAEYDLRANFYLYAPGVVPTSDSEAAMAAQYKANGNRLVTQAQVLAICGGTLPPQPNPLPRFADSNPDPRDGWSIERSEAVTYG